MPQATLLTATAPDRIDFMAKTMQTKIQNKIGLRKISILSEKDVETVAQAMAKSKKPVEFVIEFDGAWFTYFIKTGTFKKVMNEINIIEDPAVTDKAKVVDNLLLYGAADKKMITYLRERNMI